MPESLPHDPAQRKRAIRAHVQAKAMAVAPEHAAEASALICELLIASNAFHRAATLMVFTALPGEPDLTNLIECAYDAKKRVCAPCVCWEQKLLSPCLVAHWPGDLVQGRYGVHQPRPGSTRVPARELDLVLVPGVAFDRLGNRLGRGAGFYDRFLAEPALHADTCGVCFSRALLTDLPFLKHDVRVHSVVTEDGLVNCRQPPPLEQFIAGI